MVFNHPVKNFGGLTLFFVLHGFQGLMEQSNAICWFPGDDVFCWKETFGRPREMYFGVPEIFQRGRHVGSQRYGDSGGISCLSCGGFFEIAFIKKPCTFFFSKMSAFPSIFPPKKTTWFCVSIIPVFHLRAFAASERLRPRRKPPRARCVQPSVTMERSWSTSMEIDAWLDFLDDFGPLWQGIL